MSLITMAIIASIIIIISDVELSFLADIYNIGAQIAFFSTQTALIVLRIKKPDLHRPFKVPFNIRIKGKEIPITAFLGALVSFGVWLLIMITKPKGRYLGSLWILLGIMMYLIYRRRKKIPPTGQIILRKIKLPDLSPTVVKKILIPLKNINQVEMIQTACETAKCHHAKLVALHILEVPFSIPLDTKFPRRVSAAGTLLRTVEVIALEKGIEIELKIIRSRNVSEAIVEIALEAGIDLLILEWKEGSPILQRGPQTIINAILRSPPCRTWIVTRAT